MIAFRKFRSETNFGSFTADIMRDITGCEVALINSGTFRSDKKFCRAGALTLGDISSIFPIIDRVVRMKVSYLRPKLYDIIRKMIKFERNE